MLTTCRDPGRSPSCHVRMRGKILFTSSSIPMSWMRRSAAVTSGFKDFVATQSSRQRLSFAFQYELR
eukprot:6110627-Amphidinium_carterae.3